MPTNAQNELTTETVVQSPRVAGSGPLVPVSNDPDLHVPMRARLDQEYVAGGQFRWSVEFLRSLPRWVDDLSRDFGDDIYDRMQLDPQVQSCLAVKKLGILAEQWKVSPKKDIDEQDPTKPLTKVVKKSSPKAELAAEFIERNLGRVEGGFLRWLYEMLDAMAGGYRIAEQVYEIAEDGPDKGELVLKRLKIKPRESVAFVLDVFNNIVGLLGLIPGQASLILTEFIPANHQTLPNLLPREKFAVLSWNATTGDPRGHSDLRTAYTPWYGKVNLYGSYFKFLEQFASPTILAVAGETAQIQPQVDASGNPVIDPATGKQAILTPQQQLAYALEEIQNGSAGGFPTGTTFTILEMKGGEVFEEAFDQFNREIAKSILLQTLATEEGKHQTRAASQTHQDVMGLAFKHGKDLVCEMVSRDIIKPLLAYHSDPDFADLIPEFTLGDTEAQDVAALITALTAAGYELDPSQMIGIDQMLSMPARDEDWQKKAQEAARQAVATVQPVTSDPAIAKGQAATA